MPAVYGSATINHVPTDAMEDQSVQPPIGYNKLTAANTEMLNGHIGARLSQVVTPSAAAALIAADQTPAIGPESDDFKEWDTTDGTWDTAAAGGVPANTVAPAITGTTEVGEILTTTDGTWTGFPTPTLTRQWYADGVAIPGAVNLTYTLQAGDLGKEVDVVVTAVNPNGTVTAESNLVGPIAA